jgi:hypothetical protein
MSGSSLSGSWKGWSVSERGSHPKKRWHGKRKLLFLAIPLIIIALLYSSYMQARQIDEGTYEGPGGDTQGSGQQKTTTSIFETVESANLLVGFKSTGSKIPGGANVESLTFAIRSIELRTAGGEWVSAYSGSRNIDIMRYSNDSGILVQTDFPSGDYDLVRLNLTDGSIGITNPIFYIYTPRTYSLALPKGYTSANTTISLAEGDMSSLVLNFDITQSVSRIGAGYALDPKITVVESTGYPIDYILI